MLLRYRVLTALVVAFSVAPAVLRPQTTEETAVRQVVEVVAAYSQANDIAGLDMLYAPDAWVRIIEGAGPPGTHPAP